MKFTIAAAIAGLAATVAAGSNDTYVTEVLTVRFSLEADPRNNSTC